ncbi:hypothetical protein [Sediminibacillus albus]|uniref:Peptidyl-prolyl cis-trans isomerase n=1 Tax=Sediminibacillus albus TaxID=407036 RepID=A0A1G8WA48_9BACI|nr:hypothetical protein [Sediminibacillus albus]SDJ75073.1 hypothetical protein SAMN05216243_0650 [Sediminibacillus albus]
MIVQLTGKVKYPITLDPTVWIFDDRKLLFEDAFKSPDTEENEQEDELKKASMRWDREVYQQRIKPPVNKSISKFEREQILEGTYVMPIKDFLATSEIEDESKQARLITEKQEEIISLSQLDECLLLFAENGKPVKEAGPVHLYFGDGSNRQQPIKGVKKIVIE